MWPFRRKTGLHCSNCGKELRYRVSVLSYSTITGKSNKYSHELYCRHKAWQEGRLLVICIKKFEAITHTKDYPFEKDARKFTFQKFRRRKGKK